MTMPGARTVTVDGKTYSYVLKRPKQMVCPDWVVRLVVLFRPGTYVTMTFKMKAPSEPIVLAKERNGFTPALVSNVVRALEFHRAELPSNFETGGWRLESSPQGVQATED